jgi:hypothetical protein
MAWMEISGHDCGKVRWSLSRPHSRDLDFFVEPDQSERLAHAIESTSPAAASAMTTANDSVELHFDGRELIIKLPDENMEALVTLEDLVTETAQALRMAAASSATAVL